MPKEINSNLLPYFFKKSTVVWTGYRFCINSSYPSWDTYFIANNEDIDEYTALAIKRSTIKSEEGTVMNEVEIGLDNVNLSFKQDVMKGLYDNRWCMIELVFGYPFSGGYNVAGTVPIFYGLLDAPKGDEHWLTMTLRPLPLLDREFPKRVYQIGCNWLFGTPNQCDININNYNDTVVLTAQSDGTTLSCNHAHSTDYYVPGYVEIMDGEYAGDVRPVLSNDTNSVTVRIPFGYTITSGTEIKIQKLCAKNPDACQNIFNNYNNYGGYPHVPKQPII